MTKLLVIITLMALNSLVANPDQVKRLRNGSSKIYTEVNHKVIEGHFDKVDGHLVFASAKELKFDLKLNVESLSFAQKKDTVLFKSVEFFNVQSYSDIVLKSQNLALKEANSNEQIFSGDVSVKIKNKEEIIKTNVIIERSDKVCILRFPIEVKDRTKKLGLKFNSKKYSSEVELGENIIDDKLSFSFSLKCN